MSLCIGWFIPAFYEWTDSDQSRPSPLLWQMPLGAAIAVGLLTAALPWLPILKVKTAQEVRVSLRFQLRTLLGITTAVAVVLTGFMQSPLVASYVVSAATLVYFLVFFVLNREQRLQAATLIACMMFPYAWIIAYDELGNMLSDVLRMATGLPAFLPGMYLNLLLQQGVDSIWLCVLLSAIELGIGIWMLKLGPKRTLSYLLLVILTSSMGSLIFHALCLA